MLPYSPSGPDHHKNGQIENVMATNATQKRKGRRNHKFHSFPHKRPTTSNSRKKNHTVIQQNSPRSIAT
jgi:hypothetical protein